MKTEKNLHKGHYGHLKRYKQLRLIIIFVCFAFILVDVLFSLIVFQTRRTLFIIIAAIMSIPFAKNFVSYLLSLKCKPLNKEEYSRTEKISEKHSLNLLYDISVTDEDVRFFPVAAVINNNIVAYRPEATDVNEKKKSVQYLENVFSDSKDKIRICVVDSLDSFDKELGRLKASSKEASQSNNMKFKLLDAGF